MWQKKWGSMDSRQTYYERLGIAVDASPAEIIAACEQSVARFRDDARTDPSGELALLANRRIAEYEEMRDLLLDAVQRDNYDRSIGLRIKPSNTTATPAKPLRQELMMVLIGGLIGVVIVAIVWIISARLATPEIPAAAETNRPAPAFNLPRVGGGSLQLNELRGKIVLINFWGTWCAPCIEETPALQSAYMQLKDQGVEFVGINLRHQEAVGAEGDNAVAAFAQGFNVTYPIVMDVDGEIARKYQISPIPVSYFLDTEGNIRYVYVGTLTANEVMQLVKRLQENP
jgi:cytochrome c biogenesis protein CcmG/thiol:disulfide interchange protein DsbE